MAECKKLLSFQDHKPLFTTFANMMSSQIMMMADEYCMSSAFVTFAIQQIASTA